MKVLCDILVLSMEPTAYTISRGWNVRELYRGIKGEGGSRCGGLTWPIDKADRGVPWRERLCTMVRWVFQFAGEMADVLSQNNIRS